MLPPLPTDNLYKFATFGALLLFVACFWQDQQISSKLTLTLHQTERLQSDVKSELDTLEVSRKGTEELMNFVLEKLDKIERESPADYSEKKEAYLKAFDKISERKEIEKDKLKTIKNFIWAAKEQSDVYQELGQSRIVYLFGMCVSLLLLAFNMHRWQTRHQNFQDELVRIEVQKAKLELDSMVERLSPVRPSGQEYDPAQSS